MTDEDPRLYDVARQVSHQFGYDWTDPRTGVTYPPPPKPLALRIRYRVLGGHIHCRIFTAPSILDTFALAGELTFATGEWPALRALLEPVAELLPEEP